MLHQHSSATQQIAKFPFFYSKRPFFFFFSAKYSPDLGRRDDDGLGVSGRGHQPAAPLHTWALAGVIVGHRHLEYICIYNCVFACVFVIVCHTYVICTGNVHSLVTCPTLWVISKTTRIFSDILLTKYYSWGKVLQMLWSLLLLILSFKRTELHWIIYRACLCLY